MVAIQGVVKLSDQVPLSQDEWAKAKSICSAIKALLASRTAYVGRNNLDIEVELPAANWTDETSDGGPYFSKLVNDVLACPYEVINNLRLFSQSFTGHFLMDFPQGEAWIGDHDTSNSPRAILNNLDERLASIPVPNEPDHWTSLYLHAIQHLPSEIIAVPPRKLGEIGWDLHGATVSHDTYAYQERLALLFDSGIIEHLQRQSAEQGPVTILEIGGGYGGLAYYLKKILPTANYFIVDLPEALLFSTLYLSITRSDDPLTLMMADDQKVDWSAGGFTMIPNFMLLNSISHLPKVDLAINTLSLSEMSEKQVRHYAKIIATHLDERGVFFEQNQDNTHVGFNYCKEYLPDYFEFSHRVIPSSLRQLVHGQAHIWTNHSILRNVVRDAGLP